MQKTINNQFRMSLQSICIQQLRKSISKHLQKVYINFPVYRNFVMPSISLKTEYCRLWHFVAHQYYKPINTKTKWGKKRRKRKGERENIGSYIAANREFSGSAVRAADAKATNGEIQRKRERERGLKLANRYLRVQYIPYFLQCIIISNRFSRMLELCNALIEKLLSGKQSIKLQIFCLKNISKNITFVT